VLQKKALQMQGFFCFHSTPTIKPIRRRSGFSRDAFALDHAGLKQEHRG
jgi:hypothetical protein